MCMYKLHMKKNKNSPEPGNSCGIPYRKTKGFPCPPLEPVEGVEAGKPLILGHLGPIFRGELLVLGMVFIEFMNIPLEVLCHHLLQVDSQQKHHDFFRRVKKRHPKGVCESPVFKWWCWDFQEAPNLKGFLIVQQLRTLRSLFLRWRLKRHIL